MELSPAQISFFKTFGYLYFPRLFSPAEVAWITEEFELSIQACGNGAQHDGTKRTMFGGPIEHRERLCTLIDDERIVGICNGVLGANFNYASGDGNYYSGDTGWHPDGSWGQLFSVKIAFYLDDLTRDTGCLRVFPGSHHPTTSSAPRALTSAGPWSCSASSRAMSPAISRSRHPRRPRHLQPRPLSRLLRRRTSGGACLP